MAGEHDDHSLEVSCPGDDPAGAPLVLFEVRKRSNEDASARFVEAVGTADAVLRSRHDLGVVETAPYVHCETRPRRTAG